MGVGGSGSCAFRWGKMGDFFKRLNGNNHSSWWDGAFFTVLLLASKTLRAGCWTHSMHSPYPRGRFFCVHVFIFALLLFSWQFVCVFGPGDWASISPFLTKDGPAQGQLRKETLRSALRLDPIPSLTVPHEYSGAWRFRCPRSSAPVWKHKLCETGLHGKLAATHPHPYPPASWCCKADFISEAAISAAV